MLTGLLPWLAQPTLSYSAQPYLPRAAATQEGLASLKKDWVLLHELAPERLPHRRAHGPG